MRQQLVVRSLLYDATVVEDHDEVGLADRREPVGDHERCPTGHEALERVQDHGLGLRVDGEVGSSRIRIGASLMNARATQMRWRSPPESCAPRSPNCVS